MSAPPLAQQFAIVEDYYGPRIAWVFGNQNQGGVCPYRRAGLCHHCDIGDGERREFTTPMNRNRLRWFMEHDRKLLPQLAHLVVYNSGSVLNPRELSPEVLLDICDQTDAMPDLRVLSLDTRESYLNKDRLSQLVNRLPKQVCVRPILGLESADDEIRDGRLEKRMPRSAICRGLDAVADAALQASSGDIGLDANVLIGGPGVAADRAAMDAVDTARWLLYQCGQRSLSLDLNLHPYYPSRRGLARFPSHPRCSWQHVQQSVRMIVDLEEFRNSRPGLFIGWQDE
ncbi:MAG: hypothetical protein GY903_07420 [Fuerstiella sp.]|nr:hypothetical protein [Fuerstiella sp.]